MTRILLTAMATVGVAALLVSAPAPAEAGHHCKTISAKVGGFKEDAVAERARKKLKRSINRWARKAHAKVVGVRHPHVDCHKGKKGRYYTCTAKSYVCKKK